MFNQDGQSAHGLGGPVIAQPDLKIQLKERYSLPVVQEFQKIDVP